MRYHLRYLISISDIHVYLYDAGCPLLSLGEIGATSTTPRSSILDVGTVQPNSTTPRSEARRSQDPEYQQAAADLPRQPHLCCGRSRTRPADPVFERRDHIKDYNSDGTILQLAHHCWTTLRVFGWLGSKSHMKGPMKAQSKPDKMDKGDEMHNNSNTEPMRPCVFCRHRSRHHCLLKQHWRM
ncbi:hypothetical protein BR93DRAFT_124450 [Coniochaeta sp. PMI_546]|nr:hypothetical protein BR93DRAFT_124450 [Coniochaeta sp. PMI_546]